MTAMQCDWGAQIFIFHIVNFVFFLGFKKHVEIIRCADSVLHCLLAAFSISPPATPNETVARPPEVANRVPAL